MLVKLVEFTDKHLSDNYISWLNDPEVIKFSQQRLKRHTKYSSELYINEFKHKGNFFFAIEADECHVRHAAVTMLDYGSRADLGILIGDRSYWGLGVVGSAWGQAIEFLKLEKKVKKITAGTLEVNYSMRRLAEKAGMQPVKCNETLKWQSKEIKILRYEINLD